MTNTTPQGAPINIAATLATIYEVTAPKPGNVHRGADFDDVAYLDFVTSAILVGPILQRTTEIGVGGAVLEAVNVTQRAVGTNTNLGTLLLVAPLAAVPEGTRHSDGIAQVLQALTIDDTRRVYAAIRLSAAGGLGRTTEADVFEEPPATLTLVAAMRLAQERDLVARQYCSDFADVFGVAQIIEEGLRQRWPLSTAIVRAQLHQLAREADSLILRKCGAEVAEQARLHAMRTLEAGSPGDDAYEQAIADYDFWLRADGHRRNPGTTADLIAAALFVLLREGRLNLRYT